MQLCKVILKVIGITLNSQGQAYKLANQVKDYISKKKLHRYMKHFPATQLLLVLLDMIQQDGLTFHVMFFF